MRKQEATRKQTPVAINDMAPVLLILKLTGFVGHTIWMTFLHFYCDT